MRIVRARVFGLVCFAVLLLVADGCPRSPLVPGVSDSAYVATMAGLRRLPTGTSINAAARAQSRDSILRANGLTAQQFEQANISVTADPKRASEIFRAVEAKQNFTPPPRAQPMIRN